MINTGRVLVFAVNLIMLLLFMYIVLDLAEGRRFIKKHQEEQKYANEQRAIH